MSMIGVESLQRDQGSYKYLYMFVGSTCGSMHRPIFMQKLMELLALDYIQEVKSSNLNMTVVMSVTRVVKMEIVKLYFNQKLFNFMVIQNRERLMQICEILDYLS